ncbi:MAG: tetratricopeptide repeat protein, partial [Steroidobacteraceae bacterium]
AAILRGLSRFDDARAAYLSILQTDPANVTALAGLGQINRQQGDLPAALDYLHQAVALDPGRLGLRCDVAAILRGLSRFDDARAAYLSILQTDPANVTALVGLGQINRQQGDLPAALEYLQQAVSLDPGRLGLRCDVAAILRGLSRFDDARAAYLAILQTDPANVTALVGLGLIERQRGDYRASLVFFETALSNQPGHASLQADLAFTLRLLDRLDEAEAIYRSAIESDPRAAAPLRGLGYIALARGQFEAAIAFAQAACALDPQNVDSRLFLSALYRDTGQIAEASAVVDETLAAVPTHPGVWIEKGLILRNGNQRASALTAFQRAANLKRERGWIDAAVEHLALGQTEKAREAYQTVLAAAPGQFEAMMGMSGLQMLAGDYATCIETCDALIATYPKRVAPYRQKCLALIQLDRPDEALSIVSGLEASAPTFAESDAVQLEIFRTCGLRVEAQALMAQPRVATTRLFPLWFQGVLTRLVFFDLAGAEAALKDPPALRPRERSRVLYAEGMLADLQWRVRDAVTLFERALEIHDHDAGAHAHLARLYLLLADVDRVPHHLQAMIERSASSLSLRGQSNNASQNLIGQLLNELKLDLPLSVRLAGLVDEEPQRRIELLRALVQSEAGLTPPAMYLLLALRQSGAFSAATPVSDMPKSSEPMIPRKIMQYWDQTTPPKGIAELLSTWVEAHPGYQYCRFDNASARAYLRSNYPEDVLRAYRRASHPAQASDLFRLAYLFREGGFYVDADDRCVGHLSSITPANALLIAYQEQFATLGNNFLGCVPGEPVIGRALSLAVEALNRGDNDTLWLATGPGLLTRAFAEVLAAKGAAWPEWLQTRRILDRKNLADVSWPHSILRYKNTRQGWLRSAFKSRTALPTR